MDGESIIPLYPQLLASWCRQTLIICIHRPLTDKPDRKYLRFNSLRPSPTESRSGFWHLRKHCALSLHVLHTGTCLRAHDLRSRERKIWKKTSVSRRRIRLRLVYIRGRIIPILASSDCLPLFCRCLRWLGVGCWVWDTCRHLEPC